jgi:hypothetical protein
LAAILLAAYAPIGVLGYGLHRVLRCEHVTCHSCSCEHHHDHDHSHDGHTHDGVPNCGAKSPADADRLALTARDDCCGECAICAFLAQAQSTSIVAAAPERAVPLAAASDLTERLDALLRLESAWARGPPILS